jgi:flagellar motor switch protein FliG
MKKQWLSLLTVLLFLSLQASSQVPADVIGAKGFLEEVLAKRYGQGLSTLIDKNAFTIGAQLELVDIPKKKADPKPSDEPVIPFDLQVGILDSEQLIKSFGVEEEKAVLVSLLSTKRVRSVFLSVGLKSELGDEAKNKVSAWLNTRARAEFGNIAKTEVTYLQELPQKPAPKLEEKKNEWWDWLQQFQHLAGVLLMALTFLVGILLWRFTTSKSNINSNQTSDGPGIQINSGSGTGSAQEAIGNLNSTVSLKNLNDDKQVLREISELNRVINGFAEKLMPEMEALVLAWLNSGEQGKVKLASFAETVSQKQGRLPIPSDSVQEIAAIFSEMAKTSLIEKKELLSQIHLDLVTALNLGVSALSQPFSYLSSVDSEAMTKILLNQNTKLQAIVSNYLPEDVRKKFVGPLDLTQKRAMLENAAKMNEISKLELDALDSDLKTQLGPTDQTDSVELDYLFGKIVNVLTRSEELQILSHMAEKDVWAYRRTIPSIAFLHQWKPGKLKLALSKMRSDQIVAYIRTVPELKDIIVSNCSPMTAEVVVDDLRTDDRTTDSEKEGLLQDISKIMSDLVRMKEVSLEEMFPVLKLTGDSSNESRSA